MAIHRLKPRASRSALVVVDPDAPDPKAPKTTFMHWIVYNLPPEAWRIEEGIGADALPGDAGHGKTDFGWVGYGGTCPPIGEHRYLFKLYALDTMRPDPGASRRVQLESTMQDNVLTEEFMGTIGSTEIRGEDKRYNLRRVAWSVRSLPMLVTGH